MDGHEGGLEIFKLLDLRYGIEREEDFEKRESKST